MKKLFNVKKHRKFGLLLAFYILTFTLTTVPVYAVSEAALLFLLISPSPQAAAMGQTYGFIASDDPMAAIFNPASLGFFAQKYFVGISFYPGKTNWLPYLAPDITYNCRSTNVGLNLKGLPLSFGIGLNQIQLDLGKQLTGESGPEPIGEFESWEKANIITFAAAIDYYVRASIGFSYKFIESKLGSIGGGTERRDIKATPKAHDLGLIVQVPLIDIASKLTSSSFNILPQVKPFFEPGFFYSINNIGDKVTYISEAQADPLPRTVYTGVNFSTGLKYVGENFQFNLLSFKWAREADDLLVKRYGDGTWKYLSGFNKISFIENILFGKSNEKIRIRRGWEVGIGDFFFFRFGKYEDIEDKVIYETEGWGINFMQYVRIISALANQSPADNFYVRLLWNLDIEYHDSEWKFEGSHPLSGMNFKSIVFKLKNFPLSF